LKLKTPLHMMTYSLLV